MPGPRDPDPTTGVTLDLRHRPIQQRGIDRFNAILAAGRDVLVEAGLERFTMEDVAARAGVPVGSVYQFFPNKYALVAELAAQDTAAIVAAINAAVADFPTPEWQAQVDRELAHMASVWAKDRWRPAVYAAMRSTAATRQRAAENSATIAAAVAPALAALSPGMPRPQVSHVALVFVETCQTLLDLTVSSGRLDRAMLLEMQRLVRAYLRSVALA